MDTFRDILSIGRGALSVFFSFVFRNFDVRTSRFGKVELWAHFLKFFGLGGGWELCAVFFSVFDYCECGVRSSGTLDLFEGDGIVVEL